MSKCCAGQGRGGEARGRRPATQAELVLLYSVFGEVSGGNGLEQGRGQVAMRLQPANIVKCPFNQSGDFGAFGRRRVCSVAGVVAHIGKPGNIDPRGNV